MRSFVPVVVVFIIINIVIVIVFMSPITTRLIFLHKMPIYVRTLNYS